MRLLLTVPSGKLVDQSVKRVDAESTHGAFTMLTQTDGGRQRSLGEFDALFADADLHRTALYEGALHSMIEARTA